ncbi:MAG TPA: SDR family NAD(P)-dependent oxidoreductase [Fluviicola sp.]|nr:SDR family NAD(P)-dependent oxidoreductase [Fluviicola sp.]
MKTIITGTSSGIGKAIAEHYLQKGFPVVGIGRKHTIVQANYQPVVCDLTDEKTIRNLDTASWVSDDILLVNNAGMLGTVKRLSDQESPDIQQVLALNAVAPALLMNKLARACETAGKSLTVVNISSGAAKRAIPSWSAYCASKAALEMLSETFYLEEQERGRNTKVYCVAPGVVDTPMQAQIRSVGEADFAASATFHQYYENGELVSPELVAQKLSRLLEMPYSGVVSCSLRAIE